MSSFVFSSSSQDTRPTGASLSLWPAQSWHAFELTPIEAFEAWLAEARDGARPYAQSSADTYRFAFTTWLRFVRARHFLLTEVTEPLAREFFSQTALDPVTRLRYLQLLDRFYRHLNSIGAPGENPVIPLLLEYRAAPESHPAALSPSQCARLVESLQQDAGDSWKAARNRAIVALTLGAGLRSGDLLALGAARPWSTSWEIELPKINVHRAHTTRVLPKGPWRSWLTQWERIRYDVCHAPTRYVFSTSRGRAIAPFTLIVLVQQMLERAGIWAPDGGARLLRNAFALQASMVMSEADLFECLGHERLQTTQQLLARLGAQ